MWLGEYTHSLDDKNRITIPRRLLLGLERDPEGNSCAILTRGFEGCLFLFSEQGFDEVLKRLKTRAFDGAEERKMQRLFFANSHRLVLDTAGRLLVPEKLKRLVGIEREVVLIGAIDRVELWPKATWNAFESRHSKDFDDLGRVLSGEDPAALT